MVNEGNSFLSKVFQFLSYYFLPLIILSTVLAISADAGFADGAHLIQPTLSLAKDNQATLSLIISGLLLFAYLMQYQNQRIQRGIMNRQMNLMRAGYTPIIGVSNRSWGVNKVDLTADPDPDEVNRLFLELSNSGNSTARDLRLWTGLLYESTSELDNYFRSYASPLRRTSGASWWHSDKGGAIAQTEGDTLELKGDPMVKKVGRGFFKPDSEPVYLHRALEKLEHAGVEEVEVGFILKYTSTTGSEEEIHLGAYEANLSNLKEQDMWMYRAQENKEERIGNIQKGVK